MARWMDRWGVPEAIFDADDVIVDPTVLNFTSLDLDVEGNPERATPADTDDWTPEDFYS
jgi:hypothetical protein